MVLGLVAGMVSGEVEVAGLQVTAKGYVPEGQNEFNSLRAFNRQLGTYGFKKGYQIGRGRRCF